MPQHLYVMQNCHGLIKIGRSQTPDFRRRQLEGTEACEIRLVAVIDNAGEREESIHIALNDVRLIGEWFDGDKLTRMRVENLLKIGFIEWPYKRASNKTVDTWLETVAIARRRATGRREFGRCLLNMQRSLDKSTADRSRWHDSSIWSTIWRHEHGLGSIIQTKTDSDGNEIMLGYREGYRQPEIVPRFTTVVNDALGLFPDISRPSTWEGTAWECCMAALQARIKSL